LTTFMRGCHARRALVRPAVEPASQGSSQRIPAQESSSVSRRADRPLVAIRPHDATHWNTRLVGIPCTPAEGLDPASKRQGLRPPTGLRPLLQLSKSNRVSAARMRYIPAG